jgi:hypothetical protein
MHIPSAFPITITDSIAYQICTPDTVDYGTVAGVFTLVCYDESCLDFDFLETFVYTSASTGDANHDCFVNVSDAVLIINYIFVGGGPPNPCIAGDCNCDGSVNISDAVVIINYIFIANSSTPCKAGEGPTPICQ